MTSQSAPARRAARRHLGGLRRPLRRRRRAPRHASHAPPGRGGATAPATRPRGEPAWHRRARQARGNARALLRVEAGKHLLAAHHSAQRQSAMPPRRGAARGDGQDMAALRAQVLQLFDQGPWGAGRGGGGGGVARAGGDTGGGSAGGRGGQRGQGRGGGRPRGEGASRGRREGDWPCPSCDFDPNFASRTTCFRCGASRARRAEGRGAKQAGGGGGNRGPSGAGGSRPLLSAFAARAAAVVGGEPTYRVPGSSAAARAAAGPALQHGSWGPSAARTSPADKDSSALADRGMHEEGAPWAVGAPSRRSRWADEEAPCDRVHDGDTSDYMEDDLAMEAEHEEGADEEDGWEDEPSPEELRQRWLRECSAVKALAAQGKHASSAALAAAREARDQAEEDWRRAKLPVPLSVRMGFAQRKLDRAQAALTRVRYELDEFDEEVERKRADIERRIREADARYRHRVAQMDGLHEEAAGLATNTASGAADAKRAERDDEVCTMVALELQAIAESLDDGDAARGRINLLLSRVATATARQPAAQYDIAEDDDDMVLDDTTATWQADPTGRWNRSSRKGKDGGKGDGEWRAGGASAAASTGKAPGGKGATGEATATGATPAATSLAAPSAGKQGARRREDEGEDGAARSKSHRGSDEEGVQPVDTVGDDYRRALKLREEQAIAAAAAIECQAVFGDERSRQIAAQLFEHKVGLIKGRAGELGLPTTSNGKQLSELSPEELTEWIRKVLEPAELAAKSGREEDREL